MKENERFYGFTDFRGPAAHRGRDGRASTNQVTAGTSFRARPFARPSGRWLPALRRAASIPHAIFRWPEPRRRECLWSSKPQLLSGTEALVIGGPSRCAATKRLAVSNGCVCQQLMDIFLCPRASRSLSHPCAACARRTPTLATTSSTTPSLRHSKKTLRTCARQQPTRFVASLTSD